MAPMWRLLLLLLAIDPCMVIANDNPKGSCAVPENTALS